MDTNFYDKTEVYELAREEMHAVLEEFGRANDDWFIDRLAHILETRSLWNRVHTNIAGFWYAEVMIGVVVIFIAVTVPGNSYREAGVSHLEIVSLERISFADFPQSKNWTLEDVNAINLEIRDRVAAK